MMEVDSVDFMLTKTSVNPDGLGVDGRGDDDDLLDAITACDAEMKEIEDYTIAVSGVRALTILTLYERDVDKNGQDGAVRRISDVVGNNVRPALTKARKLRESLQSSADNPVDEVD